MPDAAARSDVTAVDRAVTESFSTPVTANHAGATIARRAPGGWVRSLRLMIRFVAVLDLLVIVAAMMLGWPMRELVPNVPPATSDGVALAVDLAPGLTLLWVVALFLYGAYAKRSFGAGLDEFSSVAEATVASAFAAATILYFTELPLSRGYLVSTFVVGGVLLVGERYAMRKWIHHKRVNGTLRRRVLVVGTSASVRELARVLGKECYLGYEVVACTLTNPARSTDPDLPAPASGSVHDVSATCTRLGIDTVMVAGGADLQLRDVAWNLEGKNVDLVIVPHLADISGTRMQMRPVAGLPLLHVEEPQAMRAGEWPKRLFDLAGAAAGLLIVSPLMLAVAAMIKLSDRGPVFYRQMRVGLNGEVFGCWKFRSMSVDAEAIEAELRNHYGHEGPVFKLESDPRVTRIGQFIRRYSIDELPQLFNVLGGSMSLVGPRPQQQWEVDTYSEIAHRRLHVRPGMTGLWQVSGRSRLTWDEALRLDLYYRDNWSMVSDFLIIMKTVRAVLGKDGAY
jgi:exopolysaccharide biosynthesis polyprenyl glycosylphosphotransferase